MKHKFISDFLEDLEKKSKIENCFYHYLVTHLRLNKIIGFIEQLNEVDTDSVSPLSSVTGHNLPIREDVVDDGNKNNDVLENAPEKKSGYFVVPKVIE